MRRTILAYAKQLREAKNLVARHNAVEYNNDLYIDMADKFFEDTLQALIDGTDLPDRPPMLDDRPS